MKTVCIIIAAALLAVTLATPAKAAAWGDGYNQGHTIGAGFAVQGYAVPRQIELDIVALRVAETSNIAASDRTQWLRGFESGFAQGFKDVAKPAF